VSTSASTTTSFLLQAFANGNDNDEKIVLGRQRPGFQKIVGITSRLSPESVDSNKAETLRISMKKKESRG
jgi:hypothetical protein